MRPRDVDIFRTNFPDDSDTVPGFDDTPEETCYEPAVDEWSFALRDAALTHAVNFLSTRDDAEMDECVPLAQQFLDFLRTGTYAG